MTKPIETDDDGLPFWKVRVCLPGSIVHLASRTEPVVRMAKGRVADVSMTLMTDSGDTIGFIDWPAVVALTWRGVVTGEASTVRSSSR